jgi:signal transduction histidine kinase
VKLVLFEKAYIRLFLRVVAALGIGYVTVYGINYRLNNYIEEYDAQVKIETALLLTGQVEGVITTGNLNLAEFNQYTKHPLRQDLKKFTRPGSYIQDIFLIDENNTIIVSTKPIYEGNRYTNPDEILNLRTRVPNVIKKESNEKTEIFDVIWPIIIEDTFYGHIRTVVHIGQIYDFDRARTFILWVTGLGGGLIIFLSFWLLTRPKKLEVEETGVEAKEENPSTETTPQKSEEPEAVGSVFTRLNELYEKSADLDKSFQQSEEKIHSMMRVLNQGLLILDLNMNIITHNEYLLDVFHIRRTAVAQRRVYDILQKNSRLLEIYRRTKDPLTHEAKQIFPLNLLNGRQVRVEVLARPFYNGENVSGVTFYIKNLDMVNELEQTLQKSMKYGVISQLSSSIGHEIRNPLSSLAIHTEIVDNMVSKSVEDKSHLKKIKKSISILNSEVERLQKLIDQFFNLAKSQEIQLTFENINDLMEEIHDLVQQQALEKSVRITKYLAKNLPMVKVSKDQLKQVIINLILNGYDAMPEGGDLSLRTAFRDGYVVVSVKDSGHGIPENIRDNIFDLYFTTKDTGGGIGLAISRKIIEAHEGKLYFETQTGVGTIFYIELPTSQN